MRSSGVFLSISSLPSDFGIGGFGEEIKEFCDFLKRSGCVWWQILPITTIGLGNSPYSGVSAFAGNYLYIDPIRLYKNGYINDETVSLAKYYGSPHTIDYDFVIKTKKEVLRKAYEYISKEKSYIISRYLSEHRDWLFDYALYMAIKDEQGGKPWYLWDENFKRRDNDTIAKFLETHDYELGYYICEQYLFHEQWQECRKIFRENGIKIIGDMPIYVSIDSVDVWSHPENYELDENLVPKKVAGVPPDYYSSTGQLWGNPIYNYDYMKKMKYKWFLDRIDAMFNLYDKVRIDHFRAFSEYWACDYGAENAINGEWYEGCGEELFALIKERYPNADIIAEDLGVIDEKVTALREKYNLPGMRVFQFAFDGYNTPHIPHNYERNSVVYTGTHDNNTTYGWIASLEEERLGKLQDYIGEYDEIYGGENNKYVWSVIRVLLMSVADIVIIPFQDLAGWGEDTRLNTPGVALGNWVVRITHDAISRIACDKFMRYNYITSRIAM